MVVRALALVEAAAIPAEAPLVRKEAAPVASGQCHDESEGHEHSAECGQPIPASMVHDETKNVPVKAFHDDIRRKKALKSVMGKHEPKPVEATFVNPPGSIPKPFKKNTGPDEVVGDYAPGRRYKTTEAVPSSFNDDPAGMDDTSDLDLGMLDPDNNEEIPTGDDQLWTKEEVNYRYSGDKFESCGNCVHFKFPGSCAIIAGPVRAVDVCDKFEAEDEDQGAPFGWQNQNEDDHSVDDDAIPSTLVPLQDKEPVPSKIVGGGYGGFGKSDGMQTSEAGPASAFGMEGGPGSGRHPEGGGRVASGAPAGTRIDGVQRYAGHAPQVFVTDKISGSTMMMPASKSTRGAMQDKAISKRREFYGDPAKARQAMKDTARGINSESAAITALVKRLTESAFDTLKNKLAHKKGITSPGGLAATIGRKKMGKAAFQKKAAAGRKKAKTDESVGEFMKVGPQKDAGDASGKMAYEPTQRNKKFKGMRDSGKTVAPEA